MNSNNKPTTLNLDEQLVKTAKDIGLNISQWVNHQLGLYIELNSKLITENVAKSSTCGGRDLK